VAPTASTLAFEAPLAASGPRPARHPASLDRPWRATATGLEFGPSDPAQSPSGNAAARALDELSLGREEELIRRALAEHDGLPAAWQQAGAHSRYGLRLTASELAQLVGEIDGLVRPYIALTRGEAPPDAEVAVLRLLAFRHPQS
jgi:hypothetical protein